MILDLNHHSEIRPFTVNTGQDSDHNVTKRSIMFVFSACRIGPERISFTSLHSSRGLNGSWGIKDDRATTFHHSSLSSPLRRVSPNSNPVHSDTCLLSYHLIFCLPFPVPPCTEPCWNLGEVKTNLT